MRFMIDCTDYEEPVTARAIEEIQEARTWACGLRGCPCVVPKETTLLIHLGREHQLKVFGCAQCTFRTKTKSDLKQHLIAVHDQPDAFTCDYCDYETGDVMTLAEHRILKHNEPYPLTCTICKEFECLTETALALHEAVVHGVWMEACAFCDFETFSPHVLRDHVDLHHPKRTTFHVQNVRKQFRGRVQVRGDARELVNFVGTTKRLSGSHVCPVEKCRFREIKRQHVVDHLVQDHDVLTYPCQFCEQALPSDFARTKHMFDHHQYGARACPACGHDFVFQGDDLCQVCYFDQHGVLSSQEAKVCQLGGVVLTTRYPVRTPHGLMDPVLKVEHADRVVYVDVSRFERWYEGASIDRDRERLKMLARKHPKQVVSVILYNPDSGVALTSLECSVPVKLVGFSSTNPLQALVPSKKYRVTGR